MENKPLVITHLYKDLMNLYGSCGNIASLTRYLTDSGVEWTLREVSVGSYADIEDSDLIYIGPGTERRSLMALQDIRRLKDQLQAALKNGCTILAVGTGASLFGESIVGLDKVSAEGLGFAKLNTAFDEKRRYGEYVMKTPLCEEPVVGCINTSSTIVSLEKSPLFEVQLETEEFMIEKGEGVLRDGLMLTELQGPLLWRNPHLLVALAEKLCGRALPENGEEWFLEAKKGYEKVLSELSSAREKR